jgi:hypothetical protein
MAVPAHAAPATATLTGTVIGPAATTPLTGATVVVSDPSGAKIASAPTGKDGAFTIQGVAPGVARIALQTKDGAYEVATPITLAPGETRGVHLALRQAQDEDKKKKKGGAAGMDSGKLAAMIVTIVGFTAMGVGAVSSSNDNNTNTAPASQSQPD